MAKNIFIFCDGTNNQIENDPTNVWLLFKALEQVPGEQVVYYDPGVGTMAPPDQRGIRRRLYLAWGLAFGAGLSDNIEQAYRFLMDTWEEGDRIFLFGFSRGAFTVRGLAGMVGMFGLLPAGNQHLIPYFYRSYFKFQGDAAEQARSITRKAGIEFLGLWDTVSSYGFAYNRKTLPFTMHNDRVKVIRHAMALEERRAYFRQNRWGRLKTGQDIKEVWFAGVHSDVGGGYPDHQLALIPLQWMIGELDFQARCGGYEIAWDVPYKHQPFGGDPAHFQGDAGAPRHESLKGPWWLLEYLPKNRTLKVWAFKWNWGRQRDLPRFDESESETQPDPVFVHQSVLDRETAWGPSANLDRLRADIRYRIRPVHWLQSTPDPSPPPDKPLYPLSVSLVDKAGAVLLIGLLFYLLTAVLFSVWRWLGVGERWQVLGLFTLPAIALLSGKHLLGVISGLPGFQRGIQRKVQAGALDLEKCSLQDQPGGYSHKQFSELIDALRDEKWEDQKAGTSDNGLAAFRRMLRWDLGFPFFYGAALVGALHLAVGLLDLPLERAPWLPLVLVGLVMASDWLENGLLLWHTRDHAPRSGTWGIRVASACTSVKFIGFTLLTLLPPLAWLLVTLWPSID